MENNRHQEPQYSIQHLLVIIAVLLSTTPQILFATLSQTTEPFALAIDEALALETDRYIENLEKQYQWDDHDFNIIPKPCSGDEIDTTLPWLDRTHLSLSQGLCNATHRFDRFFGNTRYNDETAHSLLRIRNNFVVENGKETDIAFQPRVRARVHLPNAKEQFNLIISDDSDNENTLSTATENLAVDNTNTNRYSTTLRWIAEKQADLEIDFDIGARFNSGIDWFVRNRYRKQIPINDISRLRFDGSVFWRNSRGFGQRTQLDYEREIAQSMLFRLENIAEFSEVTRGIDWLQRTTILNQLSYRTAVSYSFATIGHTRPEFMTDEYGFSIRYRHQLYSHWLFIEAEPQIVWPLVDPDIDNTREKITRVIIRFEVQLGYE